MPNLQRPFVSVLTPTYNRRDFIPILIQCYKNQTYSQDRMEWIVLDDGSDSVADLFEKEQNRIQNLRYIRVEQKMNIGAKRNQLNREARGDIMVCMDDDDYYPPDRVRHAVVKLQASPKLIAGSSMLFMYYTDIKKIWQVGPYGPNHGTNGTWAFKRELLRNRMYDEDVTHAEEAKFLDNYSVPMIQLDPMKTILVFAHSSNTFDKRGLRTANNPMLKETCLKLKSFVKEKPIREFYEKLT